MLGLGGLLGHTQTIPVAFTEGTFPEGKWSTA